MRTLINCLFAFAALPILAFADPWPQVAGTFEIQGEISKVHRTINLSFNGDDPQGIFPASVTARVTKVTNFKIESSSIDHTAARTMLEAWVNKNKEALNADFAHIDGEHGSAFLVPSWLRGYGDLGAVRDILAKYKKAGSSAGPCSFSGRLHVIFEARIIRHSKFSFAGAHLIFDSISGSQGNYTNPERATR